MSNQADRKDRETKQRARCVEAARWHIGRLLAHTLDPEDVVQDSIAQALAGPHHDPNADAHPSEGHVRALSVYRIRAAARLQGRQEPLDEPLPSRDVRGIADERLVAEEGLVRLRRSLARVRPEQQWTLVMRNLLGVPWETVALVMDEPSINAADCLHRRSKKALSSLLTASRTD